MTTEEKAKAYDNALERARLLKLANPDDEAIQTFVKDSFPELKESEDERIRKAILGLTYLDGIEPILTKCSVTRSDILTYLEKQKINTEGDFGRGYDCGYKACLHSHGAEWFEKQKEQKPEWNEEDEHRYGDAIYFLETAKKHYADTSEIELTIEWLKSLRPQPKQDWIKEQTKNQ